MNVNLAGNVDNAARVREFLADSLALWKVDGAVETGVLPVVAVIRVSSGATVWVERPA